MRTLALVSALAGCDKLLALGPKIRCAARGSYAVQEWTRGMPWQCESHPPSLDAIDHLHRVLDGDLCDPVELVEVTSRCAHVTVP